MGCHSLIEKSNLSDCSCGAFCYQYRPSFPHHFISGLSFSCGVSRTIGTRFPPPIPIQSKCCSMEAISSQKYSKLGENNGELPSHLSESALGDRLETSCDDDGYVYSNPEQGNTRRILGIVLRVTFIFTIAVLSFYMGWYLHRFDEKRSLDTSWGRTSSLPTQHILLTIRCR